MAEATLSDTHRRCTACSHLFPLDREHFYANKRCRGGLTTKCKACLSRGAKVYRESAAGRATVAAHRADPTVRRREQERERMRRRVRDERVREQARRAAARYRKTEHGEAKRKAFKAEYNARPEVIAKAAERERLRRSTDAGYRLSQRISAVIRSSLLASGYYKARRPWQQLLGYTRDQLKAHLARQFVGGMSWDNIGEWEIDHIVPLATFSYQSAEDPEFRAAWALTNLRPLWMSANRSKGARRTLLL